PQVAALHHPARGAHPCTRTLQLPSWTQPTGLFTSRALAVLTCSRWPKLPCRRRAAARYESVCSPRVWNTPTSRSGATSTRKRRPAGRRSCWAMMASVKSTSLAMGGGADRRAGRDADRLPTRGLHPCPPGRVRRRLRWHRRGRLSPLVRNAQARRPALRLRLFGGRAGAATHAHDLDVDCAPLSLGLA